MTDIGQIRGFREVAPDEFVDHYGYRLHRHLDPLMTGREMYDLSDPDGRQLAVGISLGEAIALSVRHRKRRRREVV